MAERAATKRLHGMRLPRPGSRLQPRLPRPRRLRPPLLLAPGAAASVVAVVGGTADAVPVGVEVGRSAEYAVEASALIVSVDIGAPD